MREKMLILAETAVGYALFKASDKTLQSDKLEAELATPEQVVSQ